jgi:hypothetical protein
MNLKWRKASNGQRPSSKNSDMMSVAKNRIRQGLIKMRGQGMEQNVALIPNEMNKVHLLNMNKVHLLNIQCKNDIRLKSIQDK